MYKLEELTGELRAASAERGVRHIQRFVASIVAGARAARPLERPAHQDARQSG
jgi:hypothetical protein